MGEKVTFKAEFGKFGTKSYEGVKKKAIFLKNVKIKVNNKKVADQVWFRATEEFEGLDLDRGDVIQFDAKVKPNIRSYIPLPWANNEDMVKGAFLISPTDVGLVNEKTSESSQEGS